MKKSKLVLACFILAFLTACSGVKLNYQYAHIGGWSQHLTSGDTTNSEHNVFGVQVNDYEIGYMKNSYDRDTFYLAHSWHGKTYIKNVEWISAFGINYGYYGCYGNDDSKQSICPHGYIGLSYTKYDIQPSIKLFGNALVFQPEIKF